MSKQCLLNQVCGWDHWGEDVGAEGCGYDDGDSLKKQEENWPQDLKGCGSGCGFVAWQQGGHGEKVLMGGGGRVLLGRVG